MGYPQGRAIWLLGRLCWASQSSEYHKWRHRSGPQVHTTSLRAMPCHWVTGEGRVNFLVPNRPLSKLPCWPELETRVEICYPTGTPKSFLVPGLRDTGRVWRREGTRSWPEGSRSLCRGYNHFVLQHEAPRCSPRPARASPSTHYSCYVSLNSVSSLKETPWQVKTAAKVKECWEFGCCLQY